MFAHNQERERDSGEQRMRDEVREGEGEVILSWQSICVIEFTSITQARESGKYGDGKRQRSEEEEKRKTKRGIEMKNSRDGKEMKKNAQQKENFVVQKEMGGIEREMKRMGRRRRGRSLLLLLSLTCAHACMREGREGTEERVRSRGERRSPPPSYGHMGA